MINKDLLFEVVTKLIKKKKINTPLKIGIDGVSASGKTYLADFIMNNLQDKTNRNIIRASLDGFHNSPDVRYKKGKNSIEGYCQDSFNYKGLTECLLDPLSIEGSRKYKKAIYDFKTESCVENGFCQAEDDSILIFEGVFLFRPEIVKYWDIKIFVRAGFDVILKRAIERDADRLRGKDKVKDKYEKRYIPGQLQYLESIHPEKLADIVIDNNDYNNPEIL